MQGSVAFGRLTLGRDMIIAFETVEQSSTVENLVQYDGKAVDISFLTCLSVNRHAGRASQLCRH